nr:MAG TPA: hypothetical protein [Bacteriophage sp.]
MIRYYCYKHTSRTTHLFYHSVYNTPDFPSMANYRLWQQNSMLLHAILVKHSILNDLWMHCHQ